MERFLASAFGVWLHSEIGKYLGPALTAEDIPKNINIVYKKLLKTYN
jgi:NAD(P)H-hydrate repair Nnr-like enzyme with NAD(P)H-hydrate dehydratase domain